MKTLSLTHLGVLLHLSQHAQREQLKMSKLWQAGKLPIENIHRRGPAETQLADLLSSLNEEELKDVIGLYGLGRAGFDSVELAREESGHALDIAPRILAERLDLHDSLIEGLKWLGGARWGANNVDGEDGK